MVLPVGAIIGSILISIVGASGYLHYQEHNGAINFYQLSIAFFLAMNILVCIWEIGLGLYVSSIEKYYKQTLLKKYKNPSEHFGVNVRFFTYTPTIAELFSLKFWAERVWGTYSLYDPSYSNNDSYGFLIDVGNGWSTLLVSIYFLVGMTSTIWKDVVDPLWLGMMGLVFFYQMLYGAVLYLAQYFYHQRHHGRRVFEVALFVGFSNGLWFLFPGIGMYCCATMIRSNSFDIIRSNHVF